jgi:hypothetical protein
MWRIDRVCAQVHAVGRVVALGAMTSAGSAWCDQRTLRVRGMGFAWRDRALGAFIATLNLSGPTGAHHLDTRPSDAIALAVRVGAPLFLREPRSTRRVR